MKVSHKWLQTYFKKPLPSSEKIAELLTFHIFEVEGIEKKAEDDVLDVKVLPDRASYCLSHEGIARELSALLPDNGFEERQLGELDVSEEVSTVDVSIESDVCDKYLALPIINITKRESPEWLKHYLEALGQRSINFLVDLANFVMLDIGEPMHVFDAEKLGGGIKVRQASEGEKIITLDNKEVSLDPSVTVVADQVSPLAIAGIKGGKKAETETFSNRIILEAAHFDPTSVRRTSTKLSIKTDSSKRFENGVSPEMADRAIKYFATLLKKEDPDALVGNIITTGSAKKRETKIEIDPRFISTKLGLSADQAGKDITTDEILACLARGSIMARHEGGIIAVYPASYRTDLNIQEDIVDEVGRLYGYENIPPILPNIKVDVTPNVSIAWRNTVRNLLVERGYSEVYTYTLKDRGEAEIANPLASDKSFYRSDLQSAMEDKLKDNLYYADLLGLSKIKLFEFGHVYRDGREYMALSIGVAYKKAKKGERVNDEIKQIRDELFAHIGSSATSACTIDDSGGIISLDGRQIGMINNLDGILELDFDALIERLPQIESVRLPAIELDRRYKPFSSYPFIVRDVAVFAPSSIRAEDVFAVIERNASDLMVRHELFDVFNKGDQTSYAYRLVFQSYEKTLTDDEVGRIMDKIYEALKGQGWTIR